MLEHLAAFIETHSIDLVPHTGDVFESRNPPAEAEELVFLELPKYRSDDAPEGTIDRWAYCFREAENLAVEPSALSVAPYREALEVARMAGFSAGECRLRWQPRSRPGVLHWFHGLRTPPSRLH